MLSKEEKKERRREYSRKWRAANLETVKASANRYYQNNKDKAKEYRTKNADKVNATKRAYAAKTKELKQEQDRTYYIANAEKIKQRRLAFYYANKAKILQNQKEYYTINKNKIGEINKNWRKVNRAKVAAYGIKYRAKKNQAQPKWLNQEQLEMLDAIYRQCEIATELTGVSHHVDHIVPLQGETVCGLHVPWNLQVVTADYNHMKQNKYIEPTWH